MPGGLGLLARSGARGDGEFTGAAKALSSAVGPCLMQGSLSARLIMKVMVVRDLDTGDFCPREAPSLHAELSRPRFGRCDHQTAQVTAEAD
jgi:hypothetical protein